MKKIECQYAGEGCTETFTRKSNMLRHVNTIHKGIKPFKCLYCDRSFARNADRKTHENHSHMMIKPYQCGFCFKQFSRNSDKNKHEKIHLRKQQKMSTQVAQESESKEPQQQNQIENQNGWNTLQIPFIETPQPPQLNLPAFNPLGHQMYPLVPPPFCAPPQLYPGISNAEYLPFNPPSKLELSANNTAGTMTLGTSPLLQSQHLLPEKRPNYLLDEVELGEIGPNLFISDHEWNEVFQALSNELF